MYLISFRAGFSLRFRAGDLKLDNAQAFKTWLCNKVLANRSSLFSIGSPMLKQLSDPKTSHCRAAVLHQQQFHNISFWPVEFSTCANKHFSHFRVWVGIKVSGDDSSFTWRPAVHTFNPRNPPIISSSLHLISALTFPPSAWYSFSSALRSLAKPKSVIFTCWGVFTRTFRAAKSLCTRWRSSK